MKNIKLMLGFYKRKFKLLCREIRVKIFKIFYDHGNGLVDVGDNFLHEYNIQKIIVVTTSERIGDLLVKTPIFREIKKEKQNIKISVVLKDGGAKDIIQYNPNINKIYHYDKIEIKRLSVEIKKEKYDLMLYLTDEIKGKEIKFIKNCSAKYNFGINKKNWKIFNITVEEINEVGKEKHISQITKMILQKLGINEPNITYDLYLDEKRKEQKSRLEEQFKNKKVIVLNPYSAKNYRSFSNKSIIKILEILVDYNVILLYYGNKYMELNEITRKYKNVYLPKQIESILDSALYVEIADLVITPDTGIVHISSVYNKKMIVVYAVPKGNKDGIKDHKVWHPLSDCWKAIYIKEEKNKYDYNHINIDINNVDFSEIKESLEEMFI